MKYRNVSTKKTPGAISLQLLAVLEAAAGSPWSPEAIRQLKRVPLPPEPPSMRDLSEHQRTLLKDIVRKWITDTEGDVRVDDDTVVSIRAVPADPGLSPLWRSLSWEVRKRKGDVWRPVWRSDDSSDEAAGGPSSSVASNPTYELGELPILEWDRLVELIGPDRLKTFTDAVAEACINNGTWTLRLTDGRAVGLRSVNGRLNWFYSRGPTLIQRILQTPPEVYYALISAYVNAGRERLAVAAKDPFHKIFI